MTKIYSQLFLNGYSLTSPYGHLYSMDTSYRQFVWSQKEQKSCIPYLYYTNTSVKWTLGSVPLVSVLKRVDCTSLRQTPGVGSCRFSVVLF